jgi:hypothetical protein
MSVLPWTLARQAGRSRHALLLLVLAALLYGFGLHAARACVQHSAPQEHVAAGAGPCHGQSGVDVDVAEAACELHCRTDVQSGRLSLSFDLPAAAPAPAVVTAPAAPVDLLAALVEEPPRGSSGPPLHILLHRLLR